MLTTLYLVAAILQSALAVILCGQYRRGGTPFTLIPLLVISALVADNLIIGLGRFIGAGDTLKALNSIRFITHALLTSWMILFAFDIAGRVGLRWARSDAVKCLFWALAIGLCALGVYMDIAQLRMELVAESETLRYRNAGHVGPPIPSIVVILVMTIVGLHLWIKTKSPWVFVGALIELVCAPLGFRFPIIGQFGEIAFCGAMISGERLAQNAARITR
jgi:hypothetical protein